jgi:hypothetical protein
MFMVYFDYMLSIARLSLCLCIRSQSARSNVHGVSGQYCVSVVLIHCLPTDAPYILDHVADREGDSLVESFVVHLPFVDQVGSGCDGSQALFFIFLSNVSYV